MNRQQMLSEAKQRYHAADFRSFMRNMQGLRDDDFQRPIPAIKQFILTSTDDNPVRLFFGALKRAEAEWTAAAPVPVNSEWHHFIVPGVLLAALRNHGYSIRDADVEEGMRRGERFAGGSCGFSGTCGGAYSLGIVASIVNRTTPLHDEERQGILRLVAETLVEISQVARRCCRRSSYVALQVAGRYLSENGYPLPVSEIRCPDWRRNGMCAGARCPYHPQA